MNEREKNEFSYINIISGYGHAGIVYQHYRRAKDKGLLSIEAVNIRDYTLERHKKVDDYPYGGGAGMLMQAQPVYDAWKSVVDRIGYKPRTVYLTPQGPTFTQPMAKDLAQAKDLILLCGHYEGIDERV